MAPRMRLPTSRCATGSRVTVICSPGIQSDENLARKLPTPSKSWTPSRTSSSRDTGAATASPVRRSRAATIGTMANTSTAPAR